MKTGYILIIFVCSIMFLYFNAGECLSMDLDDKINVDISNDDKIDKMPVNEKFVKIRAKQQKAKSGQNSEDGSIIVNKNALTIYNYVDSKKDIKAVGDKKQKVTAAGSVIVNKGAKVGKVVNVVKSKKDITAVGDKKSEVTAAGSIIIRKGAKAGSTRNVIKAKNIKADSGKKNNSDKLTFTDDF